MSKPQKSFIPPDFFGQAKTMFYVEGSAAAILVTRTGRKMKDEPMPFPTAEAALGWCRSNRALFVYQPLNLSSN